MKKDFGDARIAKEKGMWDSWKYFHDRLENIVIPNNKKLLDFFRHNKMEVTYERIGCYHEDGRDKSPAQRSPVQAILP